MTGLPPLDAILDDYAVLDGEDRYRLLIDLGRGKNRLGGSILAQKENDFVLAARAVGVRRPVILVGHILPNAIAPAVVQGTLALATAIIDVAGIGFLGLGPQDPGTPEWGTMLTDVERYLQSAPHLVIFPGIAIVVSVLGFNLIGDGLREALDPKLRDR